MHFFSIYYTHQGLELYEGASKFLRFYKLGKDISKPKPRGESNLDFRNWRIRSESRVRNDLLVVSYVRKFGRLISTYVTVGACVLYSIKLF